MLFRWGADAASMPPPFPKVDLEEPLIRNGRRNCSHITCWLSVGSGLSLACTEVFAYSWESCLPLWHFLKHICIIAQQREGYLLSWPFCALVPLITVRQMSRLPDMELGEQGFMSLVFPKAAEGSPQTALLCSHPLWEGGRWLWAIEVACHPQWLG